MGFVTCKVLPEPDHDEPVLMAACTAAGLDAGQVAWDDPDARPSDFDLLVLRSCWNYHLAVGDFLDWVDSASRQTRLLNPPDVVRWNSHKGYLRDLEARGCPVVPTAHVSRGSAVSLNGLMVDRGWQSVVVKPAVSCASYRTARFTLDEAAEGQAFLRELLRDGDALVQPFLPSVETVGERSVVWIDGEATHAVLKKPRFGDDEERVDPTAGPTREERRLLELALEPMASRLVYARLDLMLSPSGEWQVSELELIEPSLFFTFAPEAADRFVKSLLAFQEP